MRLWCIEGIELNRERIASNVDRSLMLVTALTPALGYDAAAAIAHRAHRDGITLREAALASGAVSAEDFDRLTDPRAMTTGRPGGSQARVRTGALRFRAAIQRRWTSTEGARGRPTSVSCGDRWRSTDRRTPARLHRARHTSQKTHSSPMGTSASDPDHSGR
jgi:hypothetical protein